MPKKDTELTAQELEQRASELAQKEAALAQKEDTFEKKKKKFLDNGTNGFQNAKEKFYDKLPFTVRQMDIFIGICFALIVLFLILGLIH